MASATVTIPARFNGPPTSANGGYACGALAVHLDGTAEVTLRLPPPLERPLDLTVDAERALLHDGELLIAEARPSGVDLAPPRTVTPDEAARATGGYDGFTRHAFPTCFVCGPQRAAGDGLRLFPGPVDGADGIVAAPWTPTADVAGADGAVDPAVVWAALDCPSYFGGPVGRLAVLGRLTAQLRAAVQVGVPYVVLGWRGSSEGRKHDAASAIVDADGTAVAVARARWIELRDDGPA